MNQYVYPYLSDAAVHAEDLVLNDRSNGEPVESLVDCGKDTTARHAQSGQALILKPVHLVHLRVLVVAAYEKHLAWVPDFDAKEQCHDFQAMRPSVYKVPDEHVVNEMHVPISMVGLAVSASQYMSCYGRKKHRPTREKA